MNSINIKSVENVDINDCKTCVLTNWINAFYDDTYNEKFNVNLDDNEDVFEFCKKVDKVIPQGHKPLIKEHDGKHYLSLKINEYTRFFDGKTETPKSKLDFKNKEFRFCVIPKIYNYKGKKGIMLKVMQVQLRKRVEAEMSCMFD